ncbi:hypothetical protein BDW74DRAFT_178086 [Aspergillus multicolor]|uniref:uncharacterized protein n=1 Tax=Aspergillus multicolor TaxID=41759 RepID=UPI003CCD317E
MSSSNNSTTNPKPSSFEASNDSSSQPPAQNSTNQSTPGVSPGTANNSTTTSTTTNTPALDSPIKDAAAFFRQLRTNTIAKYPSATQPNIIDTDAFFRNINHDATSSVQLRAPPFDWFSTNPAVDPAFRQEMENIDLTMTHEEKRLFAEVKEKLEAALEAMLESPHALQERLTLIEEECLLLRKFMAARFRGEELELGEGEEDGAPCS